MTKWTKGPWIVGKSQDNDIHCVDAKNDKGHTIELCEVWGTERDTQETKESMANARLMASAPDLYEALAELDEAYCRAGGDLTRAERMEDRQRLIAARAALAKARGES